MRKKQHPDQWTRDRLQPENHFITRWGIIVKDVICNIYAFIRRIQLLYFMYIIYFGWVVYNIIPDVSINVQTREIHNFTQGASMVRHLLLEWGRKSVNRTKHNMNETLEHYLVCERSCLGHIDRFLFFIFLSAIVVVCQWRQQLPWFHASYVFCLIERPLATLQIYCAFEGTRCHFRKYPKCIWFLARELDDNTDLYTVNRKLLSAGTIHIKTGNVGKQLGSVQKVT